MPQATPLKTEDQSPDDIIGSFIRRHRRTVPLNVPVRGCKDAGGLFFFLQ